MKYKTFYFSFFILHFSFLLMACQAKPQYELVWAEEFETVGRLSDADWNYEHGFVRNHEHQWYQADNAVVADGCLVIEARHDSIPNPGYRPAEVGDDENAQGRRRRRGDDWRSARPYAEYSSSSVNTRGKHEWLYGRFEVRAKIPTASGAWPAIWTLGVSKPWPMNGEIDIMEYYRIKGVPHILANACWANEPNRGLWSTGAVPFTHFTDRDPQWTDKFHTWRMDWDEDYLRLYLDDELLNEVPISEKACSEPSPTGFNRMGKAGEYSEALYAAFHQPHYLLLNLAIGGDNGGEPDPTDYPMRYEIDYVRIYQRK
ncbi:MAG: glycoside hydrolase family 16 protein [Bacteroidaceae bacterium]|nr:glycoside hydrolase family 16 protein [Bacteroidaceae bacterium]